MPSVEDRLKEQIILASTKGAATTDITPTTDLVNDLGYDSLQIVELAIAVEVAFGIELPDSDAEQMRSYPKLLAMVEQKVAEHAG